jgi:Tfp pilus assembly protein PilV
MPPTHNTHTGFTTLEAMLALMLISVTLVALDGATTLTLRRMTDHHRESMAADMARQQVDRIIATHCANSAGLDSSNGVAVQWTTTAINGVATVDQQLRYPIAIGQHHESLQSTVSCH